MNGTSHDEHDDTEPTTTDLIEMGMFELAAPKVKEGDEISRSILDNDDAFTLEAYLPTSLKLIRDGLFWLVAAEDPAQDVQEAVAQDRRWARGEMDPEHWVVPGKAVA